MYQSPYFFNHAKTKILWVAFYFSHSSKRQKNFKKIKKSWRSSECAGVVTIQWKVKSTGEIFSFILRSHIIWNYRYTLSCVGERKGEAR